MDGGKQAGHHDAGAIVTVAVFNGMGIAKYTMKQISTPGLAAEVVGQ